jgi:hypothetical protein
MASAHDVYIKETPKGVRVGFGDLYMYPDGHAHLTSRAIPNAGLEELGMPLTNATEVMFELATLVKRMNDKIVKKRPGAV